LAACETVPLNAHGGALIVKHKAIIITIGLYKFLIISSPQKASKGPPENFQRASRGRWSPQNAAVLKKTIWTELPFLQGKPAHLTIDLVKRGVNQVKMVFRRGESL
jgi:hypothetical protein